MQTDSPLIWFAFEKLMFQVCVACTLKSIDVERPHFSCQFFVGITYTIGEMTSIACGKLIKYTEISTRIRYAIEFRAAAIKDDIGLNVQISYRRRTYSGNLTS